MRIAVVGSRKGASLEDARAFLEALHGRHPDAVVVSGGAAGVDSTAEQTWISLGGSVISWRPYEIKQGCYGVEYWRLGKLSGLLKFPEPSFADYKSAALYRDTLIVHNADRVVAFQSDPPSSGTAFTCGFAKDQGKPVYVYSPKNPFREKQT